MQVVMCDKCKQIVSAKEVGRFIFQMPQEMNHRGYMETSATEYDVCKPCWEQLTGWMDREVLEIQENGKEENTE